MDAEFHSAHEFAMLATIRALSGVGAHVIGTDALMFFLGELDFILLNTRLIYIAPKQLLASYRGHDGPHGPTAKVRGSIWGLATQWGQ
jgi:hypothetical protein